MTKFDHYVLVTVMLIMFFLVLGKLDYIEKTILTKIENLQE